jgi:hypothetical protein
MKPQPRIVQVLSGKPAKWVDAESWSINRRCMGFDIVARSGYIIAEMNNGVIALLHPGDWRWKPGRKA